MANLIRLCSIEELNQTGACGVYVPIDGQEQGFILVIDPDLSRPSEPVIRAYRNICPHIQTPLETFPDEFLDEQDPNILICSTHGARFQVSDGACIAGPCLGQALTPVTVEIRNRDVYLRPF